MNEWSVVGVLVVLLGLVGGIMKPILALHGSIVELTALLKGITKTVSDFTLQNDACHEKLWEYNYKQDDTLKDHDTRLTVLEVTGKKA